ncbi:MAG: YjbQ family protein [Prolixibacteraceae bacterium]|nr:YjbQ family protein [Prolixibacteraceae bacterium]
MIQQTTIYLAQRHRGFHLITREILHELGELPATGILHLMIQHTSAALTLNENADPDVRRDLENFINKLIPENHPVYTHILEGSDDMPAHIKSSLFGASVTIPISNHQLNLGTWQGIYLCEFRSHAGNRQLVATIYS